MKKRLLVTSIVLLSLTLAACGNKEKDGTSESTAESSKTVETKSSTKEDQAEGETATFKGKIGEIPVLDEETVSLHFATVEAIEDPDKLIDTFNASGVTLMVDVETLKDFDPEDLEVGDELEFVINTPAQMTFSIPPQISGSSIRSIKQIN
jgi:ABC-type glycerol-3-phosphate transport system substrate-binding protein